MKRVIVPTQAYRSETLAPGVVFGSFYPGGKDGPGGEVLFDLPGGQAWSESILVGDRNDAFQLLIPDIRMPANQLWPLHWHDCWTAVVILEGRCLIGDWWMESGDVFIARPGIEYGPLLIGPKGCRLLEIFAQAHLLTGGYSPEYRDHPTLQGTSAVFLERSAVNRRNDGRQCLPCQGTNEISTGRLSPGASWDLGESDDPERGMMRDRRLAPGERLAAHLYDDWHAMLVLDGTLAVSGRQLGKDDYLLVQPGHAVGEIEAGADGAHLLELARVAAGMTPIAVN